MDNCDTELLKVLPRLGDRQVWGLFAYEPREYRLTKSLANLVYNIVETQALPASTQVRRLFRDNIALVTLLADRESDLAILSDKLCSNPAFVKALAKACP